MKKEGYVIYKIVLRHGIGYLLHCYEMYEYFLGKLNF